MTHFIPSDSPRAVVAAAFGRELATALSARDVSRKELCRVLGVGHTTLWHYTMGHTLPKVAAATAIASALDWPKLRTLVVEARTRTCRRPGCGRSFVNDIGSEARRYCTPECAAITANLRVATSNARRAGQTASQQARRGQVQRLRSGLRIADGQVAALRFAIDAMCAACEPEGLCRIADCPLRAFSPLPLATGATRMPRTVAVTRRTNVYSAEARAKRSASMTAATPIPSTPPSTGRTC